jgi:hypothetical protein
MLPLAEIAEDGCSVASAVGTDPGAGTEPVAGTASPGVEGVAEESTAWVTTRARKEMRKTNARTFTGYLLGGLSVSSVTKLIWGYIGL